MMTVKMYSIRDAVANAYGDPFVASNDEDAKRMFKCRYDSMQSSAPSSPFAMFIGDYDLFCVGTFDYNLGKVSGVDDEIYHVLSGRSLLPSATE